MNPIQEDRHNCEVPNCKTNNGHQHTGTDWDHCIFKRSNKKSRPDITKFVNNPLNMLRACANANRITKETDKWNTKKWLIDHHLEHNRKEFLEWIEHPPRKFQANDMFKIYNYIATKLDEEKE